MGYEAVLRNGSVKFKKHTTYQVEVVNGTTLNLDEATFNALFMHEAFSDSPRQIEADAAVVDAHLIKYGPASARSLDSVLGIDAPSVRRALALLESEDRAHKLGSGDGVLVWWEEKWHAGPKPAEGVS